MKDMSHTKVFSDPWILYQISLVNLATFLQMRKTFAKFYRKTLPSPLGDDYYNLLYKYYGSRDLHYLCVHGFVDGIRWLCENPLKLKELDDFDISMGDKFAIRCAVYHGHLTTMEYLLKHIKVDLGECFEILEIVAERGYPDIIKYLFTTEIPGFNCLLPDICDLDDMIYIATKNNHLEIIKYMLSFPDNGIDISALNTALCIASENGHLEIVKYLSKIDKVDASTFYNKAIILASQYGHLDIVKYLSSLPELDASSGGNDAIINASANGYLEIVKYLSNPSNGPALKYVDASDQFNNAIILASSNGHLDIVKFLSNPLNGSALKNVDASDCDNNAVGFAAKNGHLEIVKYLYTLPVVKDTLGDCLGQIKVDIMNSDGDYKKILSYLSTLPTSEN